MARYDDVLVIGAGPAGLSAAAMLGRRSIPVTVLERADHVAASWRSRYDSLYLNTPRFTSTLAGYRIPRRYGRWPARDDYVSYLEEYGHRHDLKIRFGVGVGKVDRSNEGWSVATSEGEMHAPQVVIATGHDSHPVIPDWSGREEFPGDFLHSAEYRNPTTYRGREVLVVSASNSGSEIAYELASNGAAKVWVSMRTAPPVFPREWLGMPINYSACFLDLLPDRIVDRVTWRTQRTIYGDLSEHGIPRPPVGAQTRAKHLHQGVLVDAGFVEALKRGEVELVAAVKGFDGPEVELVDATRLRPEVVVAATGFDSGLEPMVGHLGVLEASGYPPPISGRSHPKAPGIYFNGYESTISGQLRHMRRYARRIARGIERERNGG